MAYATLQDITDRYSAELLTVVADRDGDGVVDDQAVTDALADASSEIDSYLGTKMIVPLTTVPDVVVAYCVDIAVYRLASGPGRGLSEEITKRYDNAVKWLLNVSRGLVTIGVADPAGESVSLPQLAATNPERLFTRANMRGCW